jgi:DNA-binding SARP family transcriptional activator
MPVDTGPPIKLRLLGGADLRGVDRDAAGKLLSQPKVVGLLAYMALAGADGSWQRRDTLATLFWPELDQMHARAALRKGVMAIRNALGAETVLARGDEDLRLDETALECDAVRFAEDVEQGFFVRALDRYRGDLLPGFHLAGCVELDRWLDAQRTEARERACAAAWALAQMLEGESSYTAAGVWARKAVRYSWDDERVLRRTLTLLGRVGDRAGALRLYDEFARRLKVDLDAEPSAETTELVQQLRR